ncbi:hypothetical protein P7C70_g8114, partial [Phenoliferia sp. Uapishka_3]
MPTNSTAPRHEPFDAALAASLLPQLIALAEQSQLANAPTESDADARAAKLQVGKQLFEATQLRTSLAALRVQAQNLPAGDLSLDDQEYLIAKLEEEVERKREALASLAKLVPAPAESNAMETE